MDNAIAANPDVADKIRDGKVAAAGALIGAVMKEMRGQADAGRVRELILEKLTYPLLLEVRRVRGVRVRHLMNLSGWPLLTGFAVSGDPGALRRPAPRG